MNDLADNEEWLQSVGLLPNPNECEVMMASADYGPPDEPLTTHYEDVLHKLSREVVAVRQMWSREAQRAATYNRAIARHREALQWLIDTHDFDALATRVIEHVLTTIV